MKCLYCDRTVTDDSTGSLCPWHLDLDVLVDCLKDNRKPVTIKNLYALIQLGLSRGGSFVIVPADLSGLITPELAEKYQIELEESIPFDGRPMANREVTQRDFIGL